MTHFQRIFHLPLRAKHQEYKIHFSPILAETALMDSKAVLAHMKSASGGLSKEESVRRFVQTGPNVVIESKTSRLDMALSHHEAQSALDHARRGHPVGENVADPQGMDLMQTHAIIRSEFARIDNPVTRVARSGSIQAFAS